MNRAGWAFLLLAANAPLLSGEESPTFYKDVLPILQARCQNCHRPGQIAPMAFDSYPHTRPYASAIHERTARGEMPPWFADSCCGHFANDPTLTAQEVATLAAWAKAGAPEGLPSDAPPPLHWTNAWNIDPPDAVLSMPNAKPLPAKGDVPYQYVILHAPFKQDRWIRMAEIRPGDRSVVHHAVAYIRPPDSTWLRGAPLGVAFSAGDLPTPKLRHDATWTDSDLLLVYAPGSLPDRWPDDYAKLIPAGSDIILQLHYTTKGRPTSDRTSIGLVFAKQPPKKRVLTLQLTNDNFAIPPGDSNFRVEVHGSLPNDAILLSLFPHMHLRGKSFEYNIVGSHGRYQTLLRIPHYDFFWELSYRLEKSIPLPKGTVLQAVATFDNSKNNPHNPNPSATVKWGEQVWAEMMVGFFDVAVDPNMDKKKFFERAPSP